MRPAEDFGTESNEGLGNDVHLQAVDINCAVAMHDSSDHRSNHKSNIFIHIYIYIF